MKKFSQKELTPIQYGISPLKILVFNVMPNSLCFPCHWHERMEILHVDEGEILLNCNGSGYKISAGETAVINSGQTHAGVSGGWNTRYRVFMFELSMLSALETEIEQFLNPLIHGRIIIETKLRDKFLDSIFDSMCREYEKMDFAFTLFLKSDIYRLLGYLCRNYTRSMLISSNGDRKIGEILTYIDDHFDQDISVRSVSALFGYNEAYFCRKFKKAVSLSPAQYILMQRLEAAKKLLLSTDHPIESIAFECGFEDPNYFSRSFSRHAGMTPSAYRKTNR